MQWVRRADVVALESHLKSGHIAQSSYVGRRLEAAPIVTFVDVNALAALSSIIEA